LKGRKEGREEGRKGGGESFYYWEHCATKEEEEIKINKKNKKIMTSGFL
jgi:hypothetical protein